MGEEEISLAIYKKLKNNKVKEISLFVSNRLKYEKTEKIKLTKTKVLNTIGVNLGKLLKDDPLRYEKLEKLFKESLIEEKEISFGLKTGREIRRIVILALSYLSNFDYSGVMDFVTTILSYLSDWETVDTLAIFTVSKLLIKNERETLNLIDEWIKSENKWIRRLAVATIPSYIRERREKIGLCLDLLNRVMEDKDREVMKAVAWALREISKKDSDENVVKFLFRWAERKDKNIRWIIREGMKKLSLCDQALIQERMSD